MPQINPSSQDAVQPELTSGETLMWASQLNQLSYQPVARIVCMSAESNCHASATGGHERGEVKRLDLEGQLVDRLELQSLHPELESRFHIL